jgi:hypothetical protein
LEAINELEAKSQEVNQTTQDEDERADPANDLIELGMTKRQLAESAVRAFGPGVNRFERTVV